MKVGKIRVISSLFVFYLVFCLELANTLSLIALVSFIKD